MVARGRLIRLHRGVYAVGHRSLRLEGRLTAATLAAGRGAVASHLSAALLWQIHFSSRSAVDVTTSRRGTRPIAGIDLRETRTLPALDVTSLRGLPVTTPERTVVDLAPTLSRSRLERVVERAAQVADLDTNRLLCS